MAIVAVNCLWRMYTVAAVERVRLSVTTCCPAWQQRALFSDFFFYACAARGSLPTVLHVPPLALNWSRLADWQTLSTTVVSWLQSFSITRPQCSVKVADAFSSTIGRPSLTTGIDGSVVRLSEYKVTTSLKL